MLSIQSINLLCVEHLLQSNLKYEMFEHGSTYGRLAAFRHSSKFDMKTHHAAVAVRLVLVAREYLKIEQQEMVRKFTVQSLRIDGHYQALVMWWPMLVRAEAIHKNRVPRLLLAWMASGWRPPMLPLPLLILHYR